MFPGPTQLAYWEGVAIPTSIASLSREEFYRGTWILRDGRILWFTIHFRCHIANLLSDTWSSVWKERAVYYRSHYCKHYGKDWLRYFCTLWADNHLKLSAYATHCLKNWSDHVLMNLEHIATLYPNCITCVCAGELPAVVQLVPYMDIWYNVNERNRNDTFIDSFVHIAMSKLMNLQHQKRGFFSQLRMGMARFTEFSAIVVRIVHCALLGNFPESRLKLGLAARIRITRMFLFEKEELEEVYPLSEPEQAMLDKGNRINQERYPRTYFHEWILRHSGLVYMLMREWILYVVSCYAELDTVRGASFSHDRFREAVFVCTENCRLVIDKHCRKHPGKVIDWNILSRFENPIRSKNHTGIVAEYMTSIRRYNVRLRKRHLHELLYNTIRLRANDLPSKPEELLNTLPPPAGPSDAEFDFICWAEGTHGGAILDLRIFLPLGMTKQSIMLLSYLFADYYQSDPPADPLKYFVSLIYEKNPRDLVILTRALRLVIKYQSERPFLLPIEMTSKTIASLRKHKFDLEPWEITPENIDSCYFCASCNKWANHILAPPVWYFVIQGRHNNVPCNPSMLYSIPYRGFDTVENEPEDPYSQAVHRISRNIKSASYDLITGNMHCSRARNPLVSDDPSNARWREKTRASPCHIPSISIRDSPAVALEKMEFIRRRFANLSKNSREDEVVSLGREEDENDRDDEGINAEDEMGTDEDYANELADLDLNDFDQTNTMTLFKTGHSLVHTDSFGFSDFRVTPGNRARKKAASGAVAKSGKNTSSHTWRASNTKNPFIHAVFESLSTLTNCKFPLTKLNMAGAWHPRNNRTYGVCIHCGFPIRVTNVKMTTEGASCMTHRLDEYPAEHSIWYNPICKRDEESSLVFRHVSRVNTVQSVANNSLSTRRVTNGGDETFVLLLSSVADMPSVGIRCASCHTNIANRFVLVYTNTFALKWVPICGHENIGRIVAKNTTIVRADNLAHALRESTPH